MEAHGVEIIYPDKQPFMDAAAPMIERVKNDPVFHDLIDQMQKRLADTIQLQPAVICFYQRSGFIRESQ